MTIEMGNGFEMTEGSEMTIAVDDLLGHRADGQRMAEGCRVRAHRVGCRSPKGGEMISLLYNVLQAEDGHHTNQHPGEWKRDHSLGHLTWMAVLLPLFLLIGRPFQIIS